MASTIYILNGPNMNLLGVREPEKYGRTTLAEVEALCRKTASRFDLESGRVLDGPSAFSQPCLEARIRNGQIEVKRRQ